MPDARLVELGGSNATSWPSAYERDQRRRLDVMCDGIHTTKELSLLWRCHYETARTAVRWLVNNGLLESVGTLPRDGASVGYRKVSL